MSLSTPLSVGDAVGEGGRYELVSMLGQGGMGTVFRARDKRLPRDVAVKLLNPELLAHPTARQRMEREAQALARIRHANVIDIYDVLDQGTTLAMVIEFVDGGDLTGRLASGALGWEEAIQFVVGILSGLQALHTGGLIHRDMKPDNVLVDQASNTPKITDLGVAHDAQDRGMTQHGVQLGTPEYMSPEQVRGGAIDFRTDLYATGVVLYELLVGTVPFDGENVFDVKRGHVERLPDMTRLPGDVPVEVSHILQRSLEKNADDRYPSADEMREALVAVLQGHGDLTPVSQTVERRAVAAAPEAVDPEQHRRAREAYASTYAAFLNNDGVIDEKEAASLRVIAKNSDLSPEEVSAIEVEVQTSRSQEVVAVQTSQSQEVAAVQTSQSQEVVAVAPTPADSVVANLAPTSASRPWFAAAAVCLVVGAGLAFFALQGDQEDQTGAPAASTQGTVLGEVTGSLKQTPPVEKREPELVKRKAYKKTLEAPRGFIAIPAGDYPIGCVKDEGKSCRKDAQPEHSVSLRAFGIQKYEVTVADYRRCVDEGGCSRPKASDDEDCRYGKRDAERPINCVDWSQSTDYCRHSGWRLPTEFEWEAAARGKAGRRNPGDVSWSGVEQLRTGVLEWTFDRYKAYPGGTTYSSQGRVVRGGDDKRGAAPPHKRVARPEDYRSSTLGFRCATSL